MKFAFAVVAATAKVAVLALFVGSAFANVPLIAASAAVLVVSVVAMAAATR